jgi:PKD repeat protein
MTASHAYAAAGTYVIGLTVTDEEGQTASTTRTVVVGTGAPTASFAFVPTTGHTMAFDAGASTALGGATITNYAWSFGDTLSAAGPAAAVTHTYAAANTYTVTLTVTDSLGRSGVISQPVAVP